MLLGFEGAGDADRSVDPVTARGGVEPASALADVVVPETDALRRGFEFHVVDGNGVPVKGAEMGFFEIDGSRLVEAARDLDELLAAHLPLPEGLLSVEAPGYLPRVSHVAAGTEGEALLREAIVLQPLWYLPVVVQAGPRRSFFLEEGAVVDGEPRYTPVRAGLGALGLGDLSPEVELGEDEALFVRAWTAGEERAQAEVLLSFPRSQGGRSDLYRVQLARAREGAPQPVVYRIPEEPGGESSAEPGKEEAAQHWVQLRFRSERQGGWCTDANRPLTVAFDVEWSEDGAAGTQRSTRFAVWNEQRACYRVRLPAGRVTLHTTESAYPMPVDEAVSVPIVDSFPLLVVPGPDAGGDAATAQAKPHLVPLHQDARVVQVPQDFDMPSPPGTRWILQLSSDPIRHLRRSQFGSFPAVLAPGTWRLAWALGPRADVPVGVESQSTVELRVGD